MQVVQFLADNGPWSWIVAGLVLLALELVVPGGYLLWMGVAGLAVGLLTLFQPIAWPLQWLIFGGLSLVAIFLWVRFNRGRETANDSPFLNRRADRFLGHEAVLEQPIVGGFGRLVLGDSVWRISGSDLPAGARVKVVGSEGAVLKVEQVS